MTGGTGREASGIGIAAVERDTGLSKDILRVWERRYGFPRPQRDAFGERVYGQDEVDKLRLLRRLVDAGHRPGKVVARSVQELARLVEELAASAARSRPCGSADDDLAPFLDLVRGHRIDDLRARLSQAALRMGLGRFVTEVCAPLNRLVGESWARGALQIFEEHLYTEAMQAVLRAAIAAIPPPAQRPRVLLTTLPNEPHGLGLLMAEALMALDGAYCVSLGTRTPLRDIVLAAAAQRADIVALSFSACLGPNQVESALADLRTSLPGATEIWAGGGSPALGRGRVAGVVVMTGLADIPAELDRWRRASGPAQPAGVPDRS